MLCLQSWRTFQTFMERCGEQCRQGVLEAPHAILDVRERLDRGLGKRPYAAVKVVSRRIQSGGDLLQPQQDIKRPLPVHRRRDDQQLEHAPQRLVEIKQGVAVRSLEDVEFPMHALDRGSQQTSVDARGDVPVAGVQSVDDAQVIFVAQAVGLQGIRRDIRNPAVRPFDAGNIVARCRLLHLAPLKEFSGEGPHCFDAIERFCTC
ncbi:MAG: hypothetical protein OQK01_09160 [Xanthomonadales bacterium]|nr:hypothetical protein [Xanthomonadales bacterium]